MTGGLFLSDSFVALALTCVHDGLVRMHEIVGINLASSLVILSACHPGPGHMGGDAVIGLSGVFLVEGAVTLLLTLGEVSE